MQQRTLFDFENDPAAEERSGSFVDNMQLPVHRWFRYSAGFSAHWVREVIQAETRAGMLRVFDPFAGSGTVILEAERAGVEGLGIESHPFVARIARAKLRWHEDVGAFRQLGRSILEAAKRKEGKPTAYPKLISKCFPAEALTKLDALRQAEDILNEFFVSLGLTRRFSAFDDDVPHRSLEELHRLQAAVAAALGQLGRGATNALPKLMELFNSESHRRDPHVALAVWRIARFKEAIPALIGVLAPALLPRPLRAGTKLSRYCTPALATGY